MGLAGVGVVSDGGGHGEEALADAGVEAGLAVFVPCAASQETAKRSDLAGTAGYGYCASHSRYFWGMRLYLVTTVEGMPVMWCLANPKLDERDVMTALIAATTPTHSSR